MEREYAKIVMNMPGSRYVTSWFSIFKLSLLKKPVTRKYLNVIVESTYSHFLIISDD
ncbi:MAG: hypothetical protein ICPDIFCJ_00465 [Sodalis sp. Ppy]|nr:hypothetical protein [Sodalis sp. Ppy]